MVVRQREGKLFLADKLCFFKICGRIHLKGAPDLGVELGVEEVVVRVVEAEGGTEEGLGCGAVGRVAVRSF